jgi:hypothetical protein
VRRACTHTFHRATLHHTVTTPHNCTAHLPRPRTDAHAYELVPGAVCGTLFWSLFHCCVKSFLLGSHELSPLLCVLSLCRAEPSTQERRLALTIGVAHVSLLVLWFGEPNSVTVQPSSRPHCCSFSCTSLTSRRRTALHTIGTLTGRWRVARVFENTPSTLRLRHRRPSENWPETTLVPHSVFLPANSELRTHHIRSCTVR